MRFMLDPPVIGTTARRKTRTPIPPIQWVSERHIRDVCDMASTLVRMLAPVVEKPEAVSKTASVKEGISPVRINGMHPAILNTTQESAVATQPSFMKTVMFFGFFIEMRKPKSKYAAEHPT